MDGDTTQARAVAQELIDSRLLSLRRELVHEGIYHVVVEGGYHDHALTDAEADHLCELFLDGGLERWQEYANERNE